jgi:hypothetical protein
MRHLQHEKKVGNSLLSLSQQKGLSDPHSADQYNLENGYFTKPGNLGENDTAM